ncbi:hypothetical protein [Anabaena catenula]|uniref:Methyltransferase FkbM domain-containing protein n=1 Tax=Anabaena catenula FACHB-362 TaxID=2692877 RepID=A0ABR8IYE5_9NOST|nr:hypothetical protein [Anabaena catenula]MBD2691082.1 hypothetical protein [Anabaena catenula FACHB-362]
MRDNNQSQFPLYNSNNWLLQHKKIVTSQLGEDGIIEKIFEIIPNQNHWCVEFGAGDGKRFSNTYNLINNCGWSSVQIEANSRDYDLLASRYGEKNEVICLNKFISFDGENTLDKVLQTTSIPVDFDFMSIDIDGNDYYIWYSLEVYHPKVVMIEFNPTIPHYIYHVQPKDQEVYHGSSLLALQALGQKKGYELIASTEWNAIFVDSQYFPLFGIKDNSIWQMNHNYQFWTYVFQLYDGTIVVGGNNMMIWHDVEVHLPSIQELIQVLPPEQRKYPGRLFD